MGLYPSDRVRLEHLQRIDLAAELGALGFALALLIRWARPRLERKPDAEHAVLLLLVAGTAVQLLMFHGSIFAQWGARMPPGNAVLYLVILAVQGGFLWMQR